MLKNLFTLLLFISITNGASLVENIYLKNEAKFYTKPQLNRK